MQISRESNLVSKYLPFSLATITIFVNTNIGADPVNLPKLTLLVIASTYFLGLFVRPVANLFKTERFIFLISSLYLFGLIISLILGKSNFLTNFYGAWARNTGFLTYLMLLIIFLIFASSTDMRLFRNLLIFLYIAGLINICYGLVFVLSGQDPIKWANRYGKFLSTLGNPDFASGFLGLAYAVGIYLAIDKSRKLYFRIASGILLPVFVFIIMKTGALQGLVLVAFSTGLFLLIWLFEKFRSKGLRITLLASAVFGFLLSLLGTLQIGPLQHFLYKPSVSIRGAYWRAAIEMFKSSPIYGIGLDSYGDWYRRSRDAAALVLPGVDVTTDTAHNVFLDILAGGGLLLFIPYIALFIFVTFKGFENLKRNPKDPVAIGLLVTWLGYVAQSAISINQIGLAIWGWALAGAIIGYSRLEINFVDVNKKIKKKSEPDTLKDSTVLVTFILFSIGLTTILPVQIAEAKWQTAVRSKNIQKILHAADGWPRSCGRYLMTYNLFAGTTHTQQALSVIEKCRKINNNDFSSLILLEQFQLSDESKIEIKNETHRLDPLNPKYKL